MNFHNCFFTLTSIYYIKACVCYFSSIFYFFIKTMKSVFYFIEKTLFILEILKLSPFLSTLLRYKNTNGSGIIYDVMN